MTKYSSLNAIIAAFVLTFAASIVSAAPGDVDTSFGTQGISTAYSGGATAVAVQTDGKIVMVGYKPCANVSGFQIYPERRIWRVNADGTPDSSAGGSCANTLSSYPQSSYNALVIQPDGKIVAVGSVTETSGGASKFVVDRYNADLTPDTSFSSDGRLSLFISGTTTCGATAVTIQNDGKIVVAGWTRAIGLTTDFAVARITYSGSMDTSFNLTGKKSFSISYSSEILTFDQANAVLVMSGTGRIVLAGSARVATGGDQNFAIAALKSNGAIDSTFGFYGLVITDFNNEDNMAFSMASTGNGLVVGGSGKSGRAGQGFAIAKYKYDGTLDTSFSSDGKVFTSFTGGEASLMSLAVDVAGRIVAAGHCIGAGKDFALTRYNGNGSLDTTFGSNGRVITDIPGEATNLYDYGRGIALQSDGKVLAAGQSNGVQGYEKVTVVRYEP